MRLKNNSNNEWLKYDCGDSLIDIKANSEFEVSEKEGHLILRNLGAPNWVVLVKTIEEPAIIELVEKPIIIPIAEPPLKKEIPSRGVCAYCGRKNYFHNKNCTRPRK